MVTAPTTAARGCAGRAAGRCDGNGPTRARARHKRSTLTWRSCDGRTRRSHLTRRSGRVTHGGHARRGGGHAAATRRPRGGHVAAIPHAAVTRSCVSHAAATRRPHGGHRPVQQQRRGESDETRGMQRLPLLGWGGEFELACAPSGPFLSSTDLGCKGEANRPTVASSGRGSWCHARPHDGLRAGDHHGGRGDVSRRVCDTGGDSGYVSGL